MSSCAPLLESPNKLSRSINDKYKIDRGRLRIVWEMQKPKNLYVTTHGHELRGVGGCWKEGSEGQRGIQGRKIWDNYNSIANKTYFKKLIKNNISTVQYDKYQIQIQTRFRRVQSKGW